MANRYGGQIVYTTVRARICQRCDGHAFEEVRTVKYKHLLFFHQVQIEVRTVCSNCTWNVEECGCPIKFESTMRRLFDKLTAN
jgi:hypothetical protein